MEDDRQQAIRQQQADEQARAQQYGGDYSTAAHRRPFNTPAPSRGGGGKGGGRVGPHRTRAITHTAPAPGIFDDYSGPQVDAAKTVIKTYMGFLGWPQSVDTEQMALELLKNGLENKPQDAFEHLWNSKFLNDDMRKANPWARFGQDADTYHQNLASTTDMIKRMTGMDVTIGDMSGVKTPQYGQAQSIAGLDLKTGGASGDIRSRVGTTDDAMSLLLQSSIKYGWSQQQIMDALQAGTFTDIGGQKVDLNSVTAAEPWLLAGQTYQAQAQQYHTIYGAAPVDTAQLAGWYRFNQSAAQIGPWYARQAISQAPAKGTLGSPQTEVR